MIIMVLSNPGHSILETNVAQSKQGKKGQTAFTLQADESLTKRLSLVGSFFFFLNTIQSLHSLERP